MADPFPPDEARERRIAAWISGAGHAALIAWVALGGALFRPQAPPAIRMAEVETMSEAQFQQMAAASRGRGPVADAAAATPAQPRPPDDEVVPGGAQAVEPGCRGHARSSHHVWAGMGGSGVLAHLRTGLARACGILEARAPGSVQVRTGGESPRPDRSQ